MDGHGVGKVVGWIQLDEFELTLRQTQYQSNRISPEDTSQNEACCDEQEGLTKLTIACPQGLENTYLLALIEDDDDESRDHREATDQYHQGE